MTTEEFYITQWTAPTKMDEFYKVGIRFSYNDMIKFATDYADTKVKEISSNVLVSGSLPDFQDVIEARIKHFNRNHHTYEGSDLQNALNTIRRLVPPIQFKIGVQ